MGSGIKGGTTVTKGTAAVADSLCCGYGADGKGSSFGVDCLMGPGAVKGSSPYTAQVPISQCGAAAGLAYSAGVYSAPATTTAHKTVCCKHIFSNIFTLENYFYSNFNLFHCFQLPQYLFELP